MIRLPVSQLDVELQHLVGKDDLLLAEANELDIDLAVRLARRLTRTADGDVLDIGQLPVTDLDTLFLVLRRMYFGDIVRAEAICPAGDCQKRLDLSFRIGDFLAYHQPKMPARVVMTDEPGWFRVGGCPAVFRLPTTADLLAVVRTDDAEQLLAERCVRPSGQRPSVLRRLQNAMSSMAPNLCEELEGTCPECGTVIRLQFDPQKYVLSELRTDASSIHEDVHTLAFAYHWHEADILALPRRRRTLYVEMALEQRRSA
jgi:hypothetical protein